MTLQVRPSPSIVRSSSSLEAQVTSLLGTSSSLPPAAVGSRLETAVRSLLLSPPTSSPGQLQTAAVTVPTDVEVGVHALCAPVEGRAAAGSTAGGGIDCQLSLTQPLLTDDEARAATAAAAADVTEAPPVSALIALIAAREIAATETSARLHLLREGQEGDATGALELERLRQLLGNVSIGAAGDGSLLTAPSVTLGTIGAPIETTAYRLEAYHNSGEASLGSESQLSGFAP